MKRFKLEEVKEVYQENNYIVVVMKDGEKLVLDGGEFTANGTLNYLRDYDKFVNDGSYLLGKNYIKYKVKNDLYNKLKDMRKKDGKERNRNEE